MEYLVITLIILLIINLFNKQKRNTDIDVKLLRVRNDMDKWFACMTAYMKDIENHQKLILQVKESINMLNAHFVMTNSELDKHFPSMNTKTIKKPKFTLVQLKKKVDKLTKKEKKKMITNTNKSNFNVAMGGVLRKIRESKTVPNPKNKTFGKGEK